LAVEAVKQRIRALAREQPGIGQSLREAFGWRPPKVPPFIGKVEGSTFTLRRDINYRNSFVPQIRGSISPVAAGTIVVVSMSLPPLVVAFMTLCLGWVGALAVGLLSGGALGQAVGPAAMFVIAAALAMAGFYAEAEKARRILAEAIQA
jgi:hypothetical protein